MIHINEINILASVTQTIQSRVSSSWPWYIIRASGFTAVALLVLLTISGIGQVTGFVFRYIEPIKAWAIHKTIAFALCGAVAIHGIFLLVDHYVKFSLPQILVPFLNRYSNGSNLLGINLSWFAIASGIIAAYGIVIIVVSSLTMIDKNKKTWKLLHYLSYAVAILVFFHSLSSGSDLKYGIFRLGFIALWLAIIFAIISRIYRAGIIKNE
jgi:hypothetical protein